MKTEDVLFVQRNSTLRITSAIRYNPLIIRIIPKIICA